MAEVDFKRVAGRDLAEHLDQRLKTVLQDFMDRCADLEVEYEMATTLALNIMAHYAACAAHGVNATENELLTLCRWHFGKAAGLARFGGR